jgi:hypothetical protein
MAPKKKTKKKSRKLNKVVTKNRKPVKKTAAKKPAKKKASLAKKPAKKKPSLKVAVVKAKAPGKKKAAVKTTAAAGRRATRENQSVDSEAFVQRDSRERSAGQSGDLQGLSDIEGADSESVDELVEEGNAFEADVVAGVESAGDDGVREVHTHEVPEDDVPGEYLDED